MPLTVLLFFLLLPASITAAGQLLFKIGAQIVAKLIQPSQNIIQKAFTVIFEPHIFIAIILYMFGLFLWVYLIARTQLTIAYPINVALSILFTSIIAIFIFQESFTIYKVFGIALIITGIFFLTTGKGF